MPNNAPHNALRAAVNRAIANGAPVYTNQPADYGPVEGAHAGIIEALGGAHARGSRDENPEGWREVDDVKLPPITWTEG